MSNKDVVTNEYSLLFGDCLERMKELPDGSVDLILTDPPYGTTACKWDSVIDFTLMWEQLNRVIKPNGAIVLFGSEPFSSYLRMSNIKQYKYDWIWEKDKPSNFALASHRVMKYHENISVFFGGNYYPQMTQGAPNHSVGKGLRAKPNESGADTSTVRNKTDGIKHPKSVIKFNRESKPVHPTQKPVALLEYLIKTYTLEGETVLDNTMGSGSTGVACVNTGRNFIGIEKDEGYFKIAKNRIADALNAKEQSL